MGQIMGASRGEEVEEVAPVFWYCAIASLYLRFSPHPLLSFLSGKENMN